MQNLTLGDKMLHHFGRQSCCDPVAFCEMLSLLFTAYLNNLANGGELNSMKSTSLSMQYEGLEALISYYSIEGLS